LTPEIPIVPEKKPQATTPRPERKSQKSQHELPNWWQSVYKKKSKISKFDVSQVQQGSVGLQNAFAFREGNCLEECPWGKGNADATVVLIEGHQKHLAGAGLKMLGDMRVHMLRLQKKSLYWIPIKRENGCGHCDTMSLAQLNAIQPKAILVLGYSPLEMLRVQDKQAAEDGREFLIELNTKSVPAICTHHPMSLLEEPHKKLKARDDLLAFRGILNRLNID
jgi:hypothetical protein